MELEYSFQSRKSFGVILNSKLQMIFLKRVIILLNWTERESNFSLLKDFFLRRTAFFPLLVLEPRVACATPPTNCLRHCFLMSSSLSGYHFRPCSAMDIRLSNSLFSALHLAKTPFLGDLQKLDMP